MGWGINSVFSAIDKLADNLVSDEIRINMVIILILAAFAVIAYWYLKFLIEKSQHY